ncbi:MAG: crossover junction endodeoxyribonuclease RuvC [Patescibacteria group bacterium]
MKVLGIDPGYERLGIAILEGDANKQHVLHSECFTPLAKEFIPRLGECVAQVGKIIKEFEPTSAAFENLFVTANQKTAMRVSEVRGALLSLAHERGLSVAEYTPSAVKAAVTGYGKSDKRAVTEMLHRLLSFSVKKTHDDEYDAIAVALTHMVSSRL